VDVCDVACVWDGLRMRNGEEWCDKASVRLRRMAFAALLGSLLLLIGSLVLNCVIHSFTHSLTHSLNVVCRSDLNRCCSSTFG
jgi:hypothetical protein